MYSFQENSIRAILSKCDLGGSHMFRNLFALFSTLLLSGGAAAASTPQSTDLPLEKRIESAQKVLNKLIDGTEDDVSKSKELSKPLKEARPFDDWDEWNKRTWHQFNKYDPARGQPPASIQPTLPTKPTSPTRKK
jgi:hypothetical protein